MNSPGNTNIYLHDLSTGKTEPVTTHPAQQVFPDVFGDWVVWQDWRIRRLAAAGRTATSLSET